MYRNILIATDGTSHSSSAILEAGELARKSGSAIVLLHVLNRIVAIDPTQEFLVQPVDAS